MSSTQEYIDFSIVVEPGKRGGYLATVFDGLPNESNKVTTEQLQQLDYEKLIDAIERIRRNLDKPCEDTIKELGGYLFSWLFHKSIREAFTNQIERLGKETQKKLRIRLCFHPKLLERWDFREYLNWYWECMLVPEWEKEVKMAQQEKRWPNLPLHIRSPFLALNPSIALCRQTLGTTVFPEIAPAEPLRLLVAYYDLPTKPADYLKPMFEVFMKAIEPLRAARFVEVHDGLILGDPRSEAEPPTKEDILTKLKETNPHVFVFFGHGYEDGEGGLKVLGKDGEERLPAAEFAEAIKEIKDANLRLVVLPNCKTALMAPALLNARIPAAVAMQEKILDQPVVETIVDAFFDALRQFKPLEECVFNVRDRIRETRGEGNVHWFTPVLYLQSESGQLFASEDEIRRGAYIRSIIEKYNLLEVGSPREWRGMNEIYIDQKVGEERKEEEEQPTQDLADRMSLSQSDVHTDSVMRELVKVDLEAKLKQYRRVLLVGEADIGKTTLLQHFTVTKAQAAITGGGQIPVLIHLNDLTESDGDLRAYLAGKYLVNLNLGDEFGDWLVGQVQAGNAILLFDGLDEVSYEPSIRAKTQNALRTIAAGIGKNCPLIVTSRPSAAVGLEGFHQLQLMEFNDEQIEQYVEAYFGRQ